MKDKKIAKILKVWGYLILVFGIISSCVLFVMGLGQMSTTIFLSAAVVLFSSLVCSCAFLALSKVLFMVSVIYRITLEELEEREGLS